MGKYFIIYTLYVSLISSIIPMDLEKSNKNSTWKIKPIRDKSCICDRNVYYCDIGCCCDVDCSESETRAFIHCDQSHSDENYQFCSYYTKKNIPYTFPYNLLCVMFDNFEERNYFKEKQDITSLEEFNEVLHQQTLWMPFSTDLIDPQETYDKKFIHIKYNVEYGILTIPYSILSNKCNARLPIEIPKDSFSSCLHTFSEYSNICETSLLLVADTFYKHIKIINSGHTTDIVPYLCEESLNYCHEWNEIPQPFFKEGMCQNVVSEMKYEIYHDGFNEIKNVSAKILLKNITFPEKGFVKFLQKFYVNFFIQNQNKDSKPCSGNPGYLQGYPLLAGKLNERANQIEFIGTQWFTIPEADSDGRCILSQSSTIKFNENFVLGCFIEAQAENLQILCSQISDQLEFLFKMPSHVGAFGDSDRQRLGEWVPALKDAKEESLLHSKTCSEKVVAMNIEILYAWIGFYSNLQAKIVGLRYRYSQPINLLEFCSTEKCKTSNSLQYHLRTQIFITLSFIDVTENPSYSFAPFPIINLKLPYDFFYPFMPSASPQLLFIKIEQMIIIFLLTNNFF